MARGQPDDSNVVRQGTIIQSVPLDELAARLGSIVRFSRTGSVIYTCSFENGMAGWETVTDGTGAAVEFSCATALSGGFCVKLTGGSDDNQLASITRRVVPLVVSRHGLEVGFAPSSNIATFTLTLGVLSDGQTYEGKIRYNQGNDKLYYSDVAGVWRELDPDLSLATGAYLFHKMKVVIDADTLEYVRAVVDDLGYDMSDIALDATSLGTTKYLTATMAVVSSVAVAAAAYVDDVIVTQNEP